MEEERGLLKRPWSVVRMSDRCLICFRDRVVATAISETDALLLVTVLNREDEEPRPDPLDTYHPN